MRKLVTATLALCALGLGLSACSVADSAAPAAGEKLKVAATTTQLQDFVQQIGGDRVEVIRLLKPGSSAHSFDPSPADLSALGSAHVLVVNGAGLDDFIDSAVEASGFKGEKVVAADGIDLDAAAEITAAVTAGEVHDHSDHADHDAANHGHGTKAHAEEDGADHSDEAHDHADHDHADHDHADHDHAHEGVDPHLWTAPKNALAMVEEITDELAAADPEHADTYRKNAAAYSAKLTDLDAWITEQFAAVDPAHKKFVSTHNALLYFLHDYQIQFVGSVIPSFEDNAEPSAQEINELVANIQTAQVPAVFIESSVSDRLSTTVAREAGVPVVTDPIYADSLAAGGDAANYIGATISNTRTMLTAWGYTVEEVPSSLQ